MNFQTIIGESGKEDPPRQSEEQGSRSADFGSSFKAAFFARSSFVARKVNRFSGPAFSLILPLLLCSCWSTWTLPNGWGGSTGPGGDTAYKEIYHPDGTREIMYVASGSQSFDRGAKAASDIAAWYFFEKIWSGTVDAVSDIKTNNSDNMTTEVLGAQDTSVEIRELDLQKELAEIEAMAAP